MIANVVAMMNAPVASITLDELVSGIFLSCIDESLLAAAVGPEFVGYFIITFRAGAYQ